jgi:5-methyltetrahydropteroyltriglutamate--homocysteine methyltransferase
MFMSAVTPGQITFNFPNQHYPSHAAYLEAVAGAMRLEYEAIADAGLTLQLDSPDSAMAAHCHAGGSDVGHFREHLALAIEALNEAVADIPPEQMRFHICWGNYVGPHHRDIELREVLELVFSARPMVISFEGANPRHEHEWEVFGEIALPDDKMIMPGVIDVKSSFIEHPRLVAQRIGRFADLVGRERVLVAPDCGFSTYAGATNVDSEIAWAKLESMVEGARIASERYF